MGGSWNMDLKLLCFGVVVSRVKLKHQHTPLPMHACGLSVPGALQETRPTTQNARQELPRIEHILLKSLVCVTYNSYPNSHTTVTARYSFVWLVGSEVELNVILTFPKKIGEVSAGSKDIG